MGPFSSLAEDTTSMIGTLILTHGAWRGELLAAAEKIAGHQDSFAAVCLDWDDDCDAAEQKILQGIRQVESGDGVLVLTDTYGGTPCNLALHFRELGKVEVVSGVNLPMVMRLACNGNRRPAELEEIATWLQDKGRQAISRRRRAAGLSREVSEAAVTEREVEIVNRLGLHARAAAKLVQTAGRLRLRGPAWSRTATRSTPRASSASCCWRPARVRR